MPGIYEPGVPDRRLACDGVGDYQRQRGWATSSVGERHLDTVEVDSSILSSPTISQSGSLAEGPVSENFGLDARTFVSGGKDAGGASRHVKTWPCQGVLRTRDALSRRFIPEPTLVPEPMRICVREINLIKIETTSCV